MSTSAVPIRPIQKGSMTRLWVGIGAVALAAGGLAWWGTSRVVATKGNAEQFLSWNGGRIGVVTTKSGLQYQIVEPGDGKEKPTDTDVALVGYRGTLQDGSVFDQNEQVPMPVARVVPGFSEALKIMSKKSRYRFWLPPKLGYGATPPQGVPIPPNSVLIFDVNMAEFMPQQQYEAMAMQQQLQQQMQQQQQGGAPGGSPDPRGR